MDGWIVGVWYQFFHGHLIFHDDRLVYHCTACCFSCQIYLEPTGALTEMNKPRKSLCNTRALSTDIPGTDRSIDNDNRYTVSNDEGLDLQYHGPFY